MSWENFVVLLTGLPYTLAVTGGALIVGVVLGIPLMMLRTSRFAVPRGVAIILIALVRSVPPIVWVFLIFFAIGNSIFPIEPLPAALVGIGLIATANMAEIYRGGLAAVHCGQSEAAIALNMSNWHRFEDVLAPQVFRVCVPMVATYAIGLLKDAAVASTIGVPDLSYQGRYVTELTYQGLNVMGFVGLLYIAISIPVAWLSRVTHSHLKRNAAL
jgi:polar amino acid transport system permease protein